MIPAIHQMVLPPPPAAGGAVADRPVTWSMVGTGRSWSDADGLLAGLRDPEGRESARGYLDRVRSKRR